VLTSLWTARLLLINGGWQLTVVPPLASPRTFAVGQEQLRQLGLNTDNLLSVQPKRVEVQDNNVLVYFGSKFLQLPFVVFNPVSDELEPDQANLTNLIGPSLQGLSRSPSKQI
jgi:hypothetical protein